MSSQPSTPRQPSDQPPSSMSPSPSQDEPPAAMSTTSSNNTSFMPTPQAERTPLSPADVRTLKKIIDDVQSPSPAASTSQSEEENRTTGVETAGEDSSDIGCEDQVTYTEEQHVPGDEASDGYADEDKSMELSDGDLLAEEQKVNSGVEQEQVFDSDDEQEYVWTNGDTVEDIMNLPGKTAPPARQQDLVGLHIHDEPVSEEKKSVKQQRAAIEKILETERLEQKRRVSGTREVGVSPVIAKAEGDTIDLSDDPEIRDMEVIQAQTGMAVVANDMDGIELANIDPFTRRQTQLFSPKATSQHARTNRDPPIPAPDFSASQPAVMQTPSGKHLVFTTSAAIHDTPFSKTLNYFKQHKGKENSPSKNRRNASLPEEIAQLAKQANDEEIAELVEGAEDEEDLEKYREMDLAPMEPVLEDESAEDLITLSTPVKSDPFTAGATGTLLDLYEQDAKDFEDSNDEMSDLVAVPVANTVAELADTGLESPHAAEQHSVLSSEHDSDSGAGLDRSESPSDQGDRQVVPAPEHPTFIKVIEMLPEAVMWQARAGVAHYSNKAYEALVDKLHSLGL